ncbi:MAG: hypothetical protein PWR19_470 [Carnobacterium sp.]|nr:hypothetical protein [Carnobacterium sp.]
MHKVDLTIKVIPHIILILSKKRAKDKMCLDPNLLTHTLSLRDYSHKS